MPVYTYRREDGTIFDIRQTFRDEPLESCPTTGQAVARVIQPAGIIFKGSGFYVNDHNKSKKPASSSSKNGETAATSDQSEAKPKADSSSKTKAKAAAD